MKVNFHNRWYIRNYCP